MDKGRLTPAWRDYVCDRARYLLYRMVGAILHDPIALSKTWGKKFAGIDANLIFRLVRSSAASVLEI
jgi:hypothetical protein